MARRVAPALEQVDLGAGVDQGADLAVAALRVGVGADHGDDDRAG